MPIAVINYNTNCHGTLGCEPSRRFHGRIPFNTLDHKLGLNPNAKVFPTTDIADEFQRRTQILMDSTKRTIMQCYLKYKENCDRKVKAAPLHQHDYCFILQHIADHQVSKIPFRGYRSVVPYIVEKVLPDKNYIVRKLNSNTTQFLHRTRLRNFEPNTFLQDIKPEGNMQPDDDIIITQDDLYVITWETNFGEFLNPYREDTIPARPDGVDTSKNPTDDASTQDKIFTDVDFRSNGLHEEENPVSTD